RPDATAKSGNSPDSASDNSGGRRSTSRGKPAAGAAVITLRGAALAVSLARRIAGGLPARMDPMRQFWKAQISAIASGLSMEFAEIGMLQGRSSGQRRLDSPRRKRQVAPRGGKVLQHWPGIPE